MSQPRESNYTVVPGSDADYEGRQYGWLVKAGDDPVLRASTGGTGPCWNLHSGGEEDDDCMLHVCELDDLIVDLIALKGRGGAPPAPVSGDVGNDEPAAIPDGFGDFMGVTAGSSFGVSVGVDGIVTQWSEHDGERTEKRWTMPGRDCAWVEHAENEWWLEYQGPRAEGVTYAPTLTADIHKDGSTDLWGYSNGDMPDDEGTEPSRLFIADLGRMIDALMVLRDSDADRLNVERWDFEWKPLNLGALGQEHVSS